MMIEIRKLTESDMKQAVELRILCWTEELAGKTENVLSPSEELNLWIEWMNAAKENNDIRLLIGAFENDMMLGASFSSFAETFDIPEKGIELNGLWVYTEHRNRGISLKLLKYNFDYYIKNDIEKIVIYNHHYAPSNSFYHKFGAKVIKQLHQMNGQLLIDVFLADIISIKRNIEQSLEKYS
ncbi:GNAT family N-acetyltransferase [Clostridium algidicarnis]|uniref:GNAT family N-acetyltransferase n=1 Tax=Clostridium algidicarnis TaxID=37659 RepID=UPI001C0D5061|nr:GNAT family N-acetyltransferase [Clostridium algidicarnis]MBU3203590.1 GNAT family N-acetyltransferase [Clostridium algidicarnis]MBU3211744.1 GNAT family N-acetyltransferase [Clostridium algidicarnis]MBU3221749.1 GNAT family N-acetyltransferase [Clostridium algidicarnis]